MNEKNFLKKLNYKKKLEIVIPSENIKKSYHKKSIECLESSKILYENKLHSNSITLSYYAMYNSLIALLFDVGIKSENHNASILLLKLLFNEINLYEIIHIAKKERIDKQYYVSSDNDESLKKIAKKLIEDSEEFIFELKTIIRELNDERKQKIIKELKEIIE